MKTVLPLKQEVLKLSFVLIFSLTMLSAFAQSSTGLIFKDPSLKSGNELQKGAVYLFKNVAEGVDATVSIDNLVNGASVKKIDDNSGGLGYTDAFQPEVQIGGTGESYALFTIRLIHAATGNAELMKSVQATALDIDGNATLKEFAEVSMNGGSAIYMGGTLEILMKALQIEHTLLNKYRADNIMGLEKTGIDTTAKGNMYTVSKADVSAFTVKYGATSTNASNTSRQYGLYMQGFKYPNQVTLPLNLLSFTAVINKNNVDLKWATDAEKSVSHFVIQKSYDGKNFSDAANVFAFGNTNEVKSYNYSDNVSSSKNTVIYYRLRCVDIDSKFTYSEIRIIRISQQTTAAGVLAYPNPFVNELRVSLPHTLQGRELRIELFNANGQLVKTKGAAMASQTETISTTDLEPGFYVIRVTSGTEKTQYKVIKS